MNGFDYLWEGGPVFAQSENFRFGTDSVLLGNFINISGAKNAADLGCASGVIDLLLLSRSEKLHVTGIEIDPDAASLAGENMERNGFEDRSEILCADLRDYRKLLPAGGFDVVVSNPPYFPMNAGGVSPVEARARAREELTCTLEDLCSAAEYLCRWDGKVAFSYKPERLPELFAAMSRHGIEPKRMRTVVHTAQSAPSLVLVEGRRGGSPGLKMEPALIVKADNGDDSEEIKRIYHRL